MEMPENDRCRCGAATLSQTGRAVAAGEVDMAGADGILRDLARIRKEAPLVHSITNYVAMGATANALIAVGAAPVMAHAVEEVEEMAGLADALVLNIGTLSTPWVEAMVKAGRAAKAKGVPVVLDPAGCGATRFRTETARTLVWETSPEVIRGNASEIRALAVAGSATRGVDATHSAEEALEAALVLAGRWRCAVVVSGPADLVVSGAGVVRVSNGHPMMGKVTGMGCTATALVAAFAAVNRSYPDAAAHAMAAAGVAGEVAAGLCSGPGTFHAHFLDALYHLGELEIGARADISPNRPGRNA